MIRNNQNGRRRGRGGARPPQGGGPSGNYGNSNGGGSRIDTRQRGNATQLLEKYKAMARDATQNGDRVQAEFYMQYADHYFRVVNEFRARDPQPAQRPTYDDDEYDAPLPGQNYTQASYGDDDGDDDRRDARPEQTSDRPAGNGASNGAGNGDRGGDRYAERAPRGNDRPRTEAYSSGDARDRRDRDDRPRDRGYTQRDGEGGYAPRSEAPREARTDGRDSVRRPSDGDRQFDGANGSRRDGRTFTPRDAAPAAEEPQLIGLPGPATITAAPPVVPAEPSVAPDAESGDAPAPRRRGRPRKIVVADTAEG